MVRLDDYIKASSIKINNMMDMLNISENQKQLYKVNEHPPDNINSTTNIKLMDDVIEDARALDEESQRNEEIKRRKKNSDSMILNNASSQYNNIEIDPNVFTKDFVTEIVFQGLIYSEILGKPRCKRRRVR